MTLPEIFVKLPDPIGNLLLNLLETAELPNDPTAEEVLVAGKLLISFMKDEFPNEDDGIYMLLDQVPQAVVDQLS